MSSNHVGGGVFIRWWRTKFVGFFSGFWSPNGKKRLVFLVQMIEFIFKQSNLNSNGSTRRRRITTGGRAGATTRPGSSTGGTVGPGRRQPCRPIPLPRLLGQAIPPGHRTVVPSRRVLLPATRTSLIAK
jgi:hypothetical protein